MTQSNGEHLNAHGAGIIKVNGTFYLMGEDKSAGSSFANVNCFSSTDLVQWHYEGALLSKTGNGDLGSGRIIERPKVIYNDKTGKYVLWMHVDSSSYGEAKVGVATGDSVCGKYSKLATDRQQAKSHTGEFNGWLMSDKTTSRASSRWASRAATWGCSKTTTGPRTF
jgi:hypothetical protein